MFRFRLLPPHVFLSKTRAGGDAEARQDILGSVEHIVIISASGYVTLPFNRTYLYVSLNCSRCLDFDEQVVTTNISYGS